jgi:hypothetical protein
VFAALLGDFADPLEHQHRWQRQLRAAGEQFAPPAGEQILEFEARTPVLHSVTVLNAQWGPLTNVQRCMVRSHMGSLPNIRHQRGKADANPRWNRFKKIVFRAIPRIAPLQSKRLQHGASGDMIANETISQFNDLAI